MSAGVATERRRIRWLDLRSLPFVWRLAWSSGRLLTCIAAATAFIPTVFPPIAAWLAKKIIDGVMAAAAGEVAPELPIYYVIAELALFAAQAISLRIFQLSTNILGEKMTYALKRQVIEHATTMELAAFDKTETYDRLQRAIDQAHNRAISMMRGSLLISRAVVTIAAFSTMLAGVSPWMILAVTVSTIPGFLSGTMFAEAAFRIAQRRTPEAREMNYLELLLTRGDSAREIKAFQLAPRFLARFDTLFKTMFEEDSEHNVRRALVSVALQMFSMVVLYACYGYVVWRSAHGLLTVGDVALYMFVLREWGNSFGDMLNALREMREQALFLSETIALLGDDSSQEKQPTEAGCPELVDRSLVMEDVWFAYAGNDSPENKDNWPLRGLSLRIEDGERVAIVGANGAGKTTLISLLTGLYRPAAGRVLVGGVDVTQWAADDLRAQFAVLFQQFIRFQATVRQNVAYGAPEHTVDDRDLAHAYRMGGIDPLISKLKKGEDTQLGHWFGDGVDLSGGEWQKVALSRAFMRKAPFLVLDEPSAALDPQAEADLVRRISTLMRGQTSILISHRMKTARLADRIIVVEEGRVIESGTHQELISRGGRYSEFWNLQESDQPIESTPEPEREVADV